MWQRSMRDYESIRNTDSHFLKILKRPLHARKMSDSSATFLLRGISHLTSNSEGPQFFVKQGRSFRHPVVGNSM